MKIFDVVINKVTEIMKKYILLVLVSLCFWGCSEDEIKPYNGGNYIYFSQLIDSEDEHLEVSFNNYPTSEEITVKIGLKLIGKPLTEDTPYKVQVVDAGEKDDNIKNADPKNYRLPAAPLFKAGLVNDSLEVILVKTDDLKENVKLCLKLVPNDFFLGGMQQYEQIKIVFNNVISKPLWWTTEVTKLYLGIYSRKKYEEFVKYTNVTDFGKLSTAAKRANALSFKYYIQKNNIMDVNDDTGVQFPMTVPVN